MKSFGVKPWMLPQPVLIIGTYIIIFVIHTILANEITNPITLIP